MKQKGKAKLNSLDDAAERKREEEALRHLMDSIPDVIVIVDSSGKIHYLNRPTAGLKAEEVVGSKLHDFVPPGEKNRLKGYLEHVLKTGEILDYEMLGPGPKGTTAWYESRLIPLKEEGQIKNAILITKDITERKEAEEELRESEEKFRSLAEKSLVGIYVIQDGVFKFVNKQFLEIIGGGEKDVIGAEYTKFVAPESMDEVVRGVSRRERGKGRPKRYIFRALKKDRTEIYVEVFSAPTVYEGRPAVQGMTLDITERKRREEELKRSRARYKTLIEELQESEEKYRDLYDNAPDMYHSLDENGIIIDCNETEARMLGYKKEEIVGRPLTDFFTEESKKLFEKDFPKLNKEKVQLNLEREYIRKDGTTFPASLNIFTKFDEKGKLIRTKAISRDITERKEAEKALRESEGFLATAQEIASIGSWDWDIENNILTWSDQTYRNHGLEPGEVTPTYELFEEHLHPDDREGVNKAVEHSLETGEPYDIDLRLIIKNKEERIFRALGKVVKNEKGETIRFMGTEHDITERKRAEEALISTKGQLQHLISNTPAVIFSSNVGGDFKATFISDNIERLLGYTPDEFLNKTGLWAKCIHPEDFPGVMERLQHFIERGGYNYTDEYRFLHKDGNYCWVNAELTLIHDSKGNPKELVGYLTDIAERKQAEESLRRSVKELEAVHEIDRSIIKRPNLSSLLRFIVRKAKELTDADAAFYSFIEGDVIRHHTFLGIRTRVFKDIILKKGTGLGWLVIEENKPVVVEDFFSDERLKDAPYDAVRKEGLVSFLAVPFISGRGEPLGVLYVVNRRRTRFTEEHVRTLVTLAGEVSVAVEHAKLYEKTKNAYEELKSLDELKTNLIANVSHELRTPLTIIRSALDLAGDEEDRERKSGLLEMARDALTRQNLIVSDLIETAYMEKGKRKLRLEEVNLAHIIALVGGEFKSMTVKDKIKMDINVQEDLPMARANQKQLGHVLRNLLSNAIKFNQEGGEVVVEAKQKGDMIEVSVADTGIGIVKDDLPKVFDRLYQADASSSRAYGGTGLGLAVVKEIIEAHGGKVGVESKPGEGSRLCFTLPITKEG